MDDMDDTDGGAKTNAPPVAFSRGGRHLGGVGSECGGGVRR